MARRITPDGTTTEVVPENGRAFTLPELHRHTDCDCVDIRRLMDHRWLVCDDDGKQKGLAPNAVATFLYNQGRLGWDPVVGTVLVAEFHEVE
jgi:Domain of unknown function (DUF3846)